MVISNKARCLFFLSASAGLAGRGEVGNDIGFPWIVISLEGVEDLL
jgi:hypothetical protein